MPARLPNSETNSRTAAPKPIISIRGGCSRYETLRISAEAADTSPTHSSTWAAFAVDAFGFIPARVMLRGGESLSGRIVKLTSDAAALVILGGQQLAREFVQCFS